MVSVPDSSGPQQGALVQVEFHGDTIEAIFHKGKVWAGLKRLCESLGVDFAGQFTKLRQKPWARIEMISIRDSAGRKQETCCVDLDTLPMWLATIDAGRVAESIRPKLEAFQCEAADALRQYFFQGEAVNPRMKNRGRYQSMGRDPKWIETREKGVEARHGYTDTLKEHGVTRPFGYARCSDAINLPILGSTSKGMLAKLRLPPKARLRDHLNLGDLFAIGLAELHAGEKIERTSTQGNDECARVSGEVASHVASMVKQLQAE
jgi:hypothetical protein